MTDTTTTTPEASAPGTEQPSTWVLDPAHSSVHFAGRQMMISTVRGRFARFDARASGSEAAAEQATVELTIEAASVESGLEQRDEHLRSADFLDVERYPTITFRSTAIERSGEEGLRVTGDLTIKGVTRPVELEAVLRGLAVGMSGARRAAFSAEVTIDRRDWGITWNMPVGTDAVLVGTHVTLQFELTFEEAPPNAT
jgi:polyisoprenoid-binding protein YceI